MINCSQRVRTLSQFMWLCLAMLAAACGARNDDSLPVQGVRQALSPGPVQLSAWADTYVSALLPNQNFGSQKTLVVNQALIKFDQPALAALVPAGAAVTSARLEMTIDAALTLPVKTGSTVGVFRMTHTWTELGATFNCAADTNTGNAKADCNGTDAWKIGAPGPNPWATPATATAPIATGQTGKLSFDVTSDVRSFLNGSTKNLGWFLHSDALASTVLLALGSRESTKAPHLIISVGCAAGFADCDGNAANGCEQRLDSPANCGGCGISCDDGNLCTADTCDATAGCKHAPVADGTGCNDGNSCTGTDSCQAGVCTGGSPATCAPIDQCHAAGVCNPTTGTCSNPPLADGTACNDGNACTQADTCQAGVCTGSNPVSCTQSDQCHGVGLCDTVTGACNYPTVTDGTACNDGNACTQTDVCQAGVCTGNPVVCAAADACHIGGTCDAATGQCSNPFKNPGMACWVAQAAPTRTTITGGPWTLGQGPASNSNPTNGFSTPNPGTFNFQPYYFPFTVGDNQVMQGLFDYRPKNLEEAIVSARTTDGGQTWQFEDKVMDFNPNPVPDANNGTDDGQGHPFVMNVGGALYLYALDRTPGTVDNGGLTVHTLHPTARHPLALLPASETPPSLATLRTTGLLNPDGIMAVVPGSSPRKVIYLQKSGSGATNADYVTTLRLASTSDGLAFTDLGALTGLTDATSIWIGPRGSLLSYTDGRYGLFFSAGIASDGDADAFHFIGYAESTDLLNWTVLQGLSNPLLSIDSATDSTHGPQVWYAGRVYDPSVTLNSDGTSATMMFAGYHFAKPKDDFSDYRQIGRLILSNLGNGVTTVASDPPLFPTKDGNATACSGNDQCLSGFCVDGACCDSACGGGAADCQACSVAAGAAVDGTCGPVICQAADACHLVGTCDPAVGACSAPPAPSGTACGPSLGGFCDGAGACVGCLSANDCPGIDNACQARTCNGGTCGIAYETAGAPIAAQSAGDCHVNECDGAGNVISVIDNTDLPVDNRQCTSDVCTAGVPSNPALAAGTACTDNGGSFCGINGGCIIAQTFFVVRVGDGVTALSSSTNPVFVEEHTLDGSVVRVIPLPTTTSGANRRFTDSGSATSDGALALSGDGHFVTLAGYDAAVGTTKITSSTATANNRVVARIDAAGNVDTTTTLNNAFSGNNVRGAVTNDGSRFWVTGANGGSSGGVQTLLLGGTTGTSVTSNLSNARTLQIVGGQLYGSSNNGTFTNVFSVGSGLPIVSASATSFTGMPTSGASPFGFVLLDLNASVAGPDTLYVADDRATAAGGGIQKWINSGSTWTLVATFGTTGFRGLAGIVVGSNVWLIAGTADANGSNNLVVFVDSGLGTPISMPAGQVDGATKVLRGIALPPM